MPALLARLTRRRKENEEQRCEGAFVIASRTSCKEKNSCALFARFFWARCGAGGTFNRGGFWGGLKNYWVGFFGEILLALYFSVGWNLGGKRGNL